MFYFLYGFDYIFIWIGFNHSVEILQSYIFFYLIYVSCFILLLNWTADLKKFFFFSELVWLILFAIILSFSMSINSTHLYSHAFFILVFTACEAVTLACLLLISFESRKKTTTM